MSRPFETIVATVFEVDASEVSSEMTPDTVELWDSLSHLMLVAEIEKEYSIKLSMREIQSIDSVGRLRELIEEHSLRAGSSTG